MTPYQTLFRPLLFYGDAEWVHQQVHHLGQLLTRCPGGLWALSQLYAPPVSHALTQHIFGETFYAPIGLAAGFDKQVRLTRVAQALGFAYTEVGSISARPWPGNPKPRLFRLPKDEAILNRMGLNNAGAAASLQQLRQIPPGVPVGISIVKTPDPDILDGAALEDFGQTLRTIYGQGTYVSINISCPNTAEGKTFESPDALDALLTHLRAVEAQCRKENPLPSRPWLLKISPDLNEAQLEALFDVACRHRVDGFVATNTTASREALKTPAARLTQLGYGGISGRPLQARSTRVLGFLYQLAQQKCPAMVFIGVGGIQDTESAWDKIIHGASLLQVYTGLIYKGPGLLREIEAGLLEKLRKHQLDSIQEAVGLAYRK